MYLSSEIDFGETFLKLKQGNYVVYFGGSPRRSTLVVYSGSGVTLREVTSKQSCHSLLMEMEQMKRKAPCKDEDEKPITATTIDQ